MAGAAPSAATGAVAVSVSPSGGDVKQPLLPAYEPAGATPMAALSASANAALQALRSRWLAHNLPVLMQPTIDIKNDNRLIGMFYTFSADSTICELCVVYAGEASYNRGKPATINSVGTWCYRSFNFSKYNRTADIKYLTFRGINLFWETTRRADPPWTHVHTTDYCGDQTWSVGDKFQLLWIYSFVHHYAKAIPFSEWKMYDPTASAAGSVAAAADAKDLKTVAPAASASGDRKSSRPVVYLNTSNHMMSNVDNNPNLPKTAHVSDFTVWSGGRQSAERFGQMHVAVKNNFFKSFITCKTASPHATNSNNFQPRTFRDVSPTAASAAASASATATDDKTAASAAAAVTPTATPPATTNSSAPPPPLVPGAIHIQIVNASASQPLTTAVVTPTSYGATSPNGSGDSKHTTTATAAPVSVALPYAYVPLPASQNDDDPNAPIVEDVNVWRMASA